MFIDLMCTWFAIPYGTAKSRIRVCIDEKNINKHFEVLSRHHREHREPSMKNV